MNDGATAVEAIHALAVAFSSIPGTCGPGVKRAFMSMGYELVTGAASPAQIELHNAYPQGLVYHKKETLPQ